MNNPAYLYKEYRKRGVYFAIATFTAFLASSLFIVGFFAGTIKFWEWNSDQWPYGILGICITLAVTGFQHILYSNGDVKAGKKMTIFAFFLSFAFGMLTEVGGGMEREEARMLDKSVRSPVFQTLMNNIGNITAGIGNNPYADQIAEAEATKARHVLELGRCDRHAAKGPKRVERCEVYEQKKIDEQVSRIIAFKEMAKSADNERGNVLQGSMTQAKAFERDEENHHPLVKLIKSWFTIEFIVASFFLSSVIIGVFEFAFHYQGKSYADIRDQLLAQGYDLTNGKGIIPTRYQTPKESIVQKADELSAQQTAHAFAAKQAEAQQPLSVPPVMQTTTMASGMVQPVTGHYKPAKAPEVTASVGHTAVISDDAAPVDDSKRGIGFTAPMDELEASKQGASPSHADPAQMSTPEARALLNTISNPKFDEVFVGVATGETPTTIGKAKKQHGTGADLVQSTLVCLEYCGIVSAKDTNGKRTMIETVSTDDAQAVMEEIKTIIRGAAK